MIFDRLGNAGKYESAHGSLKAAFAAIAKLTGENAATGKYTFDGEALYANISEYDTSPRESGRFENHRRYIDIQLLVQGSEYIDVRCDRDAPADADYDTVRDIEFFSGCESQASVLLTPGSFVVLFPGELHRPGVCAGNQPQRVRKIVVKIAV